MNLDELRTALAARLSVDALHWLHDALRQVTAEPAAIHSIFPAVGRRIGRITLEAGADPGDPHAWTVDDAGRVMLLDALGDGVAERLPELYRAGDSAERRAVLRGLAVLDVDELVGADLAADALRTNDPRLVAAALVPYAAERMDQDSVDQAVLKCVFLGVPVGAVPAVRARVGDNLVGMLDDYVLERVAAGRDVPPDVWPLLSAAGTTTLPARLTPESSHSVPERADAARRAIRALRSATTRAR